MECPICKTSGLPEDVADCPNCHSDLGAYHLTAKIRKENNNRLIFSILFSVLFLVALAAALVAWFGSGNQSIEEQWASHPETLKLKSDLSTVQSDYDRLKSQEADLKKRLAQANDKTAQRKETYVVKEGETLFTIARKIYGNGFKYKDLVKANKIEDADRIFTGQKLIVYY